MKPSMFEAFDESVLLAFVEDELGGDEADRLRAALRQHPGALEALERMREDRAALRSLAPPLLPHDLVDRLEPVLARPMLVESKPGAYRRQHMRRHRQRRLVKGAMAAALFVVIGGGLIMTVLQMQGPVSPPGPDRIAMAPESDAAVLPLAGPDAGAETEPWPPAGAVVHHHAPVAEERTRHAGSEPPPSTRGERAPAPLPFALVMVTDDPDAAEQRLVARLAGLDAPLALVRNFSFDEARDIERQMLAQRRPSSRRPAVVSDVDPGAGAAPPADPDDELIRRVLAQIERSAAGRDAPRPRTSRRLLGRPALAASPRHQLAYSGQGVSHTMTVPASRLGELLGRLHELPGVAMALCWLPAGTMDPADLAWEEPPVLPLDAAQWLRDRGRIVEHLERMREDDPEAVVMLPVAIRADEP